MRKDPQLPGFDKAPHRGARKAPGTAPTNREAGLKWRCHECGEIQKYWKRAERHADEQRHHRIEVLI